MKYLVTGSTGNLARQIVAQLVAQGDDVLQVDLREPDEASGRFEQADVTDHDRMDRLVEGFSPERIIHMASLLSVTSEAQPDLAWRVNATASVALLESAERPTRCRRTTRSGPRTSTVPRRSRSSAQAPTSPPGAA